MPDILPEKWMKAMAVTTTVLGVVASVATSRASFYITKTQFNIALEADQWSYYDAKSVKQNLFETKLKGLEYRKLGATAPAEASLLDLAMQNYRQDIARYEVEKADIRKHAQDIRKQNIVFAHRGREFSLAVVFAQLAILLSGVGVLLKMRRLWIVGLVFGAVSLFFIANGFLLFYKI